MERIPPKEMAEKLVRQLRPQQPDYQYLKQVFQHIRTVLEVTPANKEKRLPELLTDQELMAFYDAVFRARNRKHAVMIKLLIFTGVRNAELAGMRITDKGESKDRAMDRTLGQSLTQSILTARLRLQICNHKFMKTAEKVAYNTEN